MDAIILGDILSQLLHDARTRELQVEVTAWRGEVTLSGCVDSRLGRNVVALMAMNTPGVIAVVNTIVVREATDVSSIAGRTPRFFNDGRAAVGNKGGAVA